MSKSETKASEITTAAPAFKSPRMGQTIYAYAGAGRRVPNNEAGDHFSDKEKDAVPVTVNVRILRLLDDGDLIRTA